MNNTDENAIKYQTRMDKILPLFVRCQNTIAEQNIIDTQFRSACIDGDLASIKKIVKHKRHSYPNVNKGLLHACYHGHLTICDYLLNSNDLGRYNADLDVLLEGPSSIEIKDGALLNACFEEHSHIINFLLYDMRFHVYTDTLEFFKTTKYQYMVDLISKRDLFFELEENTLKVSDFGKNKKNKI